MALVVCLSLVLATILTSAETGEPACDSSIFCHGALLDTVQRAKIFSDPKTFVDMPLRHSTDAVLQGFDALKQLGSLNTSMIQRFVDEHFTEPGTDMERWTPPDWKERPSLLDRIEDSELRDFASKINGFWKTLGRRVKNEVREEQDQHSLIYLPYGFIIPGDRFREVYYWDTYWIVGGLLLSDMHDTAKGVVENLLTLAERYGHVPNGGRQYYTRRGQPPLLAPMVDLYLSHTQDWGFVKRALPALEKEAAFWRGQRSLEVNIRGQTYHMAHYNADLDIPRPEGYSHDLRLAKGMKDDEAADLYSNVASACESGWDFSSRWFADMKTMKTIKTSSIIPVDLNVFLCWTDQLLAKYHGHFGNISGHQTYMTRMKERRAAIHDLMWSEQEGAWFDYDVELQRQRRTFYPSNVFPLLSDCTLADFSNEGNALKILNYIKEHDLEGFPGGIPTSLIPSGQQWDLPNSWPPLQYLMVQSIASLPHYQAQNLSKSLSKIWLKSVLKSFKEDKQMFEKYDASVSGGRGGGGEYKVQTGFGWTNGAVLMLLNKYPDILLTEKNRVPTEIIAIVVIVLLITAALILAGIFYLKRKRQLAPPYAMVQT